MIGPFSLAPTPQLHFGKGKLSVVPGIITSFGRKALLVTGARSFDHSSTGYDLLKFLDQQGISYQRYTISKEPDPATIDRAVNQFHSDLPDCVVALGGGSALDAGKAISGMLVLGEAVREYLEGVGTKNHPGTKIPFIAIPTTAGTGSEATKNAVISETGEHGYKRSLRHNHFVPDVAIVDPQLTVSCSPEITSASGMDAFTQLLESYLSPASGPITDSLALEGLSCIARSLLNSYRDGHDIEARTDMSLAAYLSGITLANAGLGVVHGFASSLGGYFNIPHGVICSRLMGPANRITVQKLLTEKSEALGKYAVVGRLFSDESNRSDAYYIDFLLDTIESMTEEMNIPRLSRFGITKHHFEKIVSSTDNKNNPIALEKDLMAEILELSL
jgi:alcohol dehydrogenase class IV